MSDNENAKASVYFGLSLNQPYWNKCGRTGVERPANGGAASRFPAFFRPHAGESEATGYAQC